LKKGDENEKNSEKKNLVRPLPAEDGLMDHRDHRTCAMVAEFGIFGNFFSTTRTYGYFHYLAPDRLQVTSGFH
jgi:hypothetical protein